MAAIEESGFRRWRPRMRFSLSALLIVTTACSIALAIGKWFFYEPPTHRIAAYEKAPGTLRTWFDVGPNRVQIRLVTRNERDGTLRYENGRGVAVQNLTAQNAQALSSAAPWLDVVQIELAPTSDRVDVIEARVFDHKTRSLINATDPAFGWRMVAPDVLQIYGLGKPIPEKLDVWFRLHSYVAGGEVKKIDAKSSSSCEFANGTKITLSETRRGLGSGWTSANGFRGNVHDDDGLVAAEFNFQWSGAANEDLQIIAVLRSGERVESGHPHFISPPPRNIDPRQLVTFDADLADVDHFEVRPFGGRERFFFDSVTLPKGGPKAFSQPPVVQINIDGREIDEQITAFEPLVVRVKTFRGLQGGRSYHSLRRGSIGHLSVVPDLARAFTFESTVTGLRMRLEGRYTLKASQQQPGGMQRTIFLGDASGGTIRATSAGYMTPLDHVESVEVQLRPDTGSLCVLRDYRRWQHVDPFSL